MSEIILQRICDTSFRRPLHEKEIEVRIQPPFILGRGPVLKCADKKISRNHGTIDWDDDGILITSTHLNPTFLIVNGKEQTLSQGQSAVLKHGDKLGLLRETFWYRVHIDSPFKTHDENDVTAPQKIKKNSNSNLDEEKTFEGEKLQNISSKNEVQDEFSVPESNAFKDENLDCNSSNGDQVDFEQGSKNEKTLAEKDGSKKQNLHSVVAEKNGSKEQNIHSVVEVAPYCCNRERKLPDWIKNSAAEKDKESALTNNASQKVKTKPHGKIQVSLPKAPKVNTKRKLQESEEEEKISKMSSKKQSNTPSKRSPKKNIKNGKKANQYHTVSQDFEISDSEQFDARILHSISDKEPKTLPPSKRSPKKNKRNGKKANQYHTVSQDFELSDNEKSDAVRLHSISDEEAAAVSSVKASNVASRDEDSKGNINETRLDEQRNTPRKSCEYGEQCYRKNPSHKKKMAHPGDDDYVASNNDQDDSDDDRPQCEYGLTCYRQNPQHQKNYKHSRKPQPQRQAKRKAKGKQNEIDDDDSENEYDFDDPFLNDDSSNDYAPTDSSGRDSDVGDGDEVEDDDTKRMLKEGKRFVRKRR